MNKLMRMNNYRLCLFCVVVTAIVAALIVLSLPPSANARSADRPISFVNDIAPILKENCYTCHDAKKKSGKLDMTSYASLRKGGANDDPIRPGKPDESEIYRLIVAQDERRMPPPDNGTALSHEKIQRIGQWIKEGGKLDVGVEPTADLLREVRKRWQPPMPPESYPAPIAITALIFTPDSQRLVVGGYHELTLWNIESQKLLRRIRTRCERTYGLAFLPNGNLAVAAGRPGQEGDVRIYDLNVKNAKNPDAGRLDGVRDPQVLLAHLFDTDDCVLALAVSADGKQLAACGCDHGIRIWNLENGIRSAKLTHSMAIHADWVTGLAFAPDGQHLLSASRDKSAKYYDLTKEAVAMNFADHQAPVFGVTASSDGRAAYSVGADKMMYLWNLTADKKVTKRAPGHLNDVVQVVRHPEAPFIITASADKSVRVWREDATLIKTLSGLPQAACSLAVSPDGKFIAAGSNDGEVRIWSFPEGKLVAQFNACPGLKRHS